jgi:hypothetical protein
LASEREAKLSLRKKRERHTANSRGELEAVVASHEVEYRIAKKEYGYAVDALEGNKVRVLHEWRWRRRRGRREARLGCEI